MPSLPVPGTGLLLEELRLIRSPHLDLKGLVRELQAQEPGLHWRQDSAVTTSLPWVVLLQVALPAGAAPPKARVGYMLGFPWTSTVEELARLGLADWDPRTPDAPLAWPGTLGPPLPTRTRRGRDLDVREWRLTLGPGVATGQEIPAGSARLVCLLSGPRGEQWTATLKLEERPLGELLQQAVARFER